MLFLPLLIKFVLTQALRQSAARQNEVNWIIDQINLTREDSQVVIESNLYQIMTGARLIISSITKFSSHQLAERTKSNEGPNSITMAIARERRLAGGVRSVGQPSSMVCTLHTSSQTISQSRSHSRSGRESRPGPGSPQRRDQLINHPYMAWVITKFKKKF